MQLDSKPVRTSGLYPVCMVGNVFNSNTVAFDLLFIYLTDDDQINLLWRDEID
jgi:hypothetical protein